jgi:sulfotransferase
MWSASRSLDNQSTYANRRRDHADEMIRALPAMYYSKIERPIVIDKCRAWTLPLNLEMIDRFISDDPKIICCVRDVPEIIRSFDRLFELNGLTYEQRIPFMSELDVSLVGLDHALQCDDQKRFLMVEYDRLVDATSDVLTEIYEFLEIPGFDHDLGSIRNENPEDDSVYGLEGMHEIRASISRRN